METYGWGTSSRRSSGVAFHGRPKTPQRVYDTLIGVPRPFSARPLHMSGVSALRDRRRFAEKAPPNSPTVLSDSGVPNRPFRQTSTADSISRPQIRRGTDPRSRSRSLSDRNLSAPSSPTASPMSDRGGSSHSGKGKLPSSPFALQPKEKRPQITAGETQPDPRFQEMYIVSSSSDSDVSFIDDESDLTSSDAEEELVDEVVRPTAPPPGNTRRKATAPARWTAPASSSRPKPRRPQSASSGAHHAPLPSNSWTRPSSLSRRNSGHATSRSDTTTANAVQHNEKKRGEMTSLSAAQLAAIADIERQTPASGPVSRLAFEACAAPSTDAEGEDLPDELSEEEEEEEEVGLEVTQAPAPEVSHVSSNGKPPLDLWPSRFGRKSVVYFPLPLTEGPSSEQFEGKVRVNRTGLNLTFKLGDSYNVIRHAFKRAGFSQTNRSGWSVYWGKMLKSDCYSNLNQYQKVNHFPGSSALGRKDRLHRHLSSYQRQFGTPYDFFPRSYLLPHEWRFFQTDFEKNPKAVWIVKPVAGCQGKGIRLCKEPKKLARKKNVIVQKYVTDPLLINGRKFDLRVYVLVTSYDPLRVYLFDDGLVRFCTEDYKNPAKSKQSKLNKSRYRHLTNYSLNKKRANFNQNTNADGDGEGDKWSFKGLRKWLVSNGYNVSRIWDDMKDLIVKSMLSVEGDIGAKTASACRHQTPFEIYGFDILLDSKLKPWLIEVNVQPSFSSSSPMDRKIKSLLVTDALNIIGVVPYDRSKHEREVESAKEKRLLGLGSGSVMKAKHRKTSKLMDNQTLKRALLTEEDVEVLRESEDELNRCSSRMERIFPTRNSAEIYEHFLQTPRYLTLLLMRWERKKDLKWIS